MDKEGPCPLNEHEGVHVDIPSTTLPLDDKQREQVDGLIQRY